MSHPAQSAGGVFSRWRSKLRRAVYMVVLAAMLRAVCRRLCAAAIVLLLAIAACGGPNPRAARSGLNTLPVSAGPSALESSARPTPVRSTGTSQLPPAVETTRQLPPTTAVPQPTGRPTSSISAACGVGRAAGLMVLALPGGRRALLAVPSGDTGRRRLGLVIGLPGFGQTPEQFAAQSRLPTRAMAAGVLAVIPQGAGPALSWNFSGTTGYDDLAFLSALTTRLVTTECADAARIVITGISDGGAMAAFAACSLRLSFRAVVTVAASTEPRPSCRPMRIIAVHGDADPLDPYRGGPDGRRGYPAVPPAILAVAAWAAIDGCAHAITSSIAPHIVTTTYSCGAQLVTVEGGGHTWPRGARVAAALGLTTSEYDATGTILGLI